MSKIVQSLAHRLGYSVKKLDSEEVALHQQFPEATESDLQAMLAARPFTMTSYERMWAVITSTKYIVNNEIPGSFVECGVWRGGSVMIMAAVLKELGATDRDVWLFDTFEGMTPPDEHDFTAADGVAAEAEFRASLDSAGTSKWCHADLNDVQRNLFSTGYPEQMCHFVKGDVVETLASSEIPEEVALLRLDTDWYASTRVELQVLYPRIASNGVCIIDDYGHWAGSREAVDEYLSEKQLNPLIARVDRTGRSWVKN